MILNSLKWMYKITFDDGEMTLAAIDDPEVKIKLHLVQFIHYVTFRRNHLSMSFWLISSYYYYNTLTFNRGILSLLNFMAYIIMEFCLANLITYSWYNCLINLIMALCLGYIPNLFILCTPLL